VRGRQLDARNGDLSITAADQNFIISKKIIIFAGSKNYKYDLLISTKQYDKYGSEIKRNKSATAHRYRRRRGKLIAALQSAASSVFGSLAAIIAFQRNHAIRKIGFMCVNFSSDLSTRLRSLLHEKCGKVCEKLARSLQNTRTSRPNANLLDKSKKQNPHEAEFDCVFFSHLTEFCTNKMLANRALQSEISLGKKKHSTKFAAFV